MGSPAINRYDLRRQPGQVTYVTYDLNGVEHQSTLQRGDQFVSSFALDRYAGASGISSSGWKFPTPWAVTRFQYALTLQQTRINDSGNDFHLLNSAAWDGTLVREVALPLSDLENRAIIAALNKLSQNGPNIGQMLGERHETARLAIDNFQRIARMYRSFRHGNPKDWARMLKGEFGPGHWPSMWLEYQYGIAPLVGDIHKAIDAVNKSSQFQQPIITVKASVKESDRFLAFNAAADGLIMPVYETWKHTGFIRLDYNINSPLEASLASLGLNNPFYVGWQLLPYSFVADWCLGIGDYISTWGADWGLGFKSGSYTQRVLSKRKGEARLLAPYTGYTNDSVRGEYFAMRRKVYLSSPTARFPVFKDPFSYYHVANAASLVATALQRGGK